MEMRNVSFRGLVLVVDDTSSCQWVVSTILENAGFTTYSVANGQEALNYLEKEGSPVAIVLDLVMPVMNGWEFLKRRESSKSLLGIPVIVHSGDILGAAFSNIVAFVPKIEATKGLVPAVEKAIGQADDL